MKFLLFKIKNYYKKLFKKLDIVKPQEKISIPKTAKVKIEKKTKKNVFDSVSRKKITFYPPCICGYNRWKTKIKGEEIQCRNCGEIRNIKNQRVIIYE